MDKELVIYQLYTRTSFMAKNIVDKIKDTLCEEADAVCKTLSKDVPNAIAHFTDAEHRDTLTHKFGGIMARKRTNDIGCWLPVKLKEALATEKMSDIKPAKSTEGQPRKRKKSNASDEEVNLSSSSEDEDLDETESAGVYSIEVNEDGYWRVRYQLENHYVRDNATGNPRLFKYKRKNEKTGQITEAERTRKIKYSMYLTHLSLLVNNKDLYKSRTHIVNGKQEDVRYSVSHLCGIRECFNPDHLICEPHIINLSRILCCVEICAHHPHKCKRPAAHITGKVLELQAIYNDNTLYSGE
jgi:hypothetical protein